MIPVRACSGKARASSSRQIVMFALHDKFRLGEGVMIARVVYIEMRTDESIDVLRFQPQRVEVLDHIYFLADSRHCRTRRVGGHPAVDQDIPSVSGLNEIAAQHHFHTSSRP